ncbi:abortive infection family protein [Burkholderia gladioli]|uniref:abortive infection family protein n=1 Tax=Burkholderia gladioli TaxID=28095 RepID=UPI00163FF8D0|nr:abortive infection family protein [Burkholderia gladioli]
MRDQIKSIMAKKKRVAEKEAAVTQVALELAEALRDGCAGLDVFAVSNVVTVEAVIGREFRRLGAFLEFNGKDLRVMWNPRGAIQMEVPSGQWWRGAFSAMALDDCPLPWLERLLTKAVVDSLLDHLRGDVDDRESQVDATLAEARSLLSADAAEIDAEMAESLDAAGDENLTRLWHAAGDAIVRDSADALTRYSSFLETVCAKILRERGVKLPKDKSMSPLVKACLETLTWPAEKEAEGDVRQLLGGIQSITNGIGALRTHFGTAHGATSHLPPLDPGYAVFVKQATVAAATFLLDRHQASPLVVDDSSPAPAG